MHLIIVLYSVYKIKFLLTRKSQRNHHHIVSVKSSSQPSLMASISLLEASIAIICLLIFNFLPFKNPHDRFLRKWPVLGMLPGFLVVLHRIYDFSVEVLESTDLTFPFKGPWFAGVDILVTVDPANIHYILSSNFSNYTKGADFKEV